MAWRMAWWTMAALCAAVAAISLVRYSGADITQAFSEQAAVYERQQLWVRMHAGFASLALLLGPLQFHGRVRAVRAFHRAIGIAYLFAVLAGATSGLVLSFQAFGTWPTRLGFALLGLCWLTSAAICLGQLLARNFREHGRWAKRHFSMTLAAVMLRLWVLALTAAGVEFAQAYALAAWLSWLPNLLVAEWLLWRDERSAGSNGNDALRFRL